MTPPGTVAYLMGVSGCGKSTIGQRLASRLDWVYVEGDLIHPPANVAKMAAEHPLDDADRLPWLDAVRDRCSALAADGRSVIAACSALTPSYRRRLVEGLTAPAVFVYLEVTPDVAAARMTEREHFFPPALLASQFDTLQEPTPDEFANDPRTDLIVLDASLSVAELVEQASHRLRSA